MWYHFYTINPKAHAKMVGTMNKLYLKLNRVDTGIKRSFCFYYDDSFHKTEYYKIAVYYM